jgi:hypothetical protein
MLCVNTKIEQYLHDIIIESDSATEEDRFSIPVNYFL